MSIGLDSKHVIVASAVLCISAALTAVVRYFALARGLLDVPNQRSSHAVATARGGGLAIVVACLAGLVALAVLERIDHALLLSFLIGGVAVAAVGFADDRYQVSAVSRLAVHLIAALWTLRCLSGLAPVNFAGRLLDSGWVGDVLTVMSFVWTINVFNFMDGIDGLAAGETTFMAGSALLIGVLVTNDVSTDSAAALVFGAACGGFLLWNWPPAKIFMGDVGSGFLGFAVATLAIAATRDNPAAPFIWLILGGVFFVDTAVTLLRRLIRRERVYEAHRTHAYQWLSRRWRSHKRVTVVIMAINLLWLLPCAVLAAVFPGAAIWISLIALTPLAVIAFVAGAGQSETNSNDAASRRTAN